MILVFLIKNQRINHEIPEIKRNQQLLKWNSSYDPHIFGLISDAHISPFNPVRNSNTKSILKILSESGVEKILVAGDISDNFGSNGSFKHGQQYENDFLEYKKIVDHYPSDFLIVASGNHDEFGVEDYNSENHYILKYCDFYKNNEIYKKYENFLISKVNYDDIEIFVMNPYHYPTVRAGVGYLMHMTTKMLDQIEKGLSEKSNSSTRLLMTHFPVSFSNQHARSSSGKSLFEIMSSSNLTSIISGHSHTYRVIHRNSSLELHSPSISPGRYYRLCYGYISIDNGGFSYQMSSLNQSKPTAVLTYPIEKKFLSKMSDFSIHNYNESEVHVVTFSENPNLNISVKCSKDNFNGGYNGYLKFQRIIRPNQSLYSIPLKKLCGELTNGFGDFHLTFSGDWSYSADFFFGDTVKLGKEVIEEDLNLYIGTFSIGLLMWLFVLYVWCPFFSPSKFCNDLNLWICGASMKPKAKYFGLLLGFLVMKSRIYNNLNKRTQFWYFIVLLSPIFLPISLMQIGKNQIGLILFFGYYLKGDFVLDFWGLDLFALFAILVLVPSTIVFSAIAQIRQTVKCHPVFIFDIGLAIGQVWLIVFAIGRFLYQSTPLWLAITSPVFGFGSLIILFLELLELRDYFVWYSSN